MNLKELKIGTRASKLALWQANFVKDSLLKIHPHLSIILHPITTKGDQILDVTLSKVGGKGLFVKEIEDALLNKTVDVAVHSLKDVPGELPQGLMLASYPVRENPSDALVSKNNLSFEQLKKGAILGSSSLRRISQLKALRPDLQFINLRGNVETRIRKMNEGVCDAIILAKAGLIRLGMDSLITEELNMIPAVAQGALGLETRVGDEDVISLLKGLDHYETRVCVEAEREFLRVLNGGCQVPLGCHATLSGQKIILNGFVASPDGSQMIQKKLEVPVDKNVEGGNTLAQSLLQAGADVILNAVKDPLV
ncbi:hydroxymethylbilane synthase [bacterium]|nr:hydroxymethylbilane synthase [bacterium]